MPKEKYLKEHNTKIDLPNAHLPLKTHQGDGGAGIPYGGHATIILNASGVAEVHCLCSLEQNWLRHFDKMI